MAIDTSVSPISGEGLSSREPVRPEPSTLATAVASLAQRRAVSLFWGMVLLAILALMAVASRPMPILPSFSVGTLFTALVVLAQLVAFSDMVISGPLVGGGRTPTWLWTFWHVGIPVMALPYALIESREPRWRTPGRMNGAQLAAEAEAIRPGLKALLTSGYTTPATGGARELPRGVPLLRKPYLRGDLAAKLHRELET